MLFLLPIPLVGTYHIGAAQTSLSKNGKNLKQEVNVQKTWFLWCPHLPGKFVQKLCDMFPPLQKYCRFLPHEFTQKKISTPRLWLTPSAATHVLWPWKPVVTATERLETSCHTKTNTAFHFVTIYVLPVDDNGRFVILLGHRSRAGVQDAAACQLAISKRAAYRRRRGRKNRAKIQESSRIVLISVISDGSQKTEDIDVKQ